MWRTWAAAFVLAAGLGASAALAGGTVSQTDDPGVLLRAAMEKEEVDGDLQGAIEQYTRIVGQFADQPAVAAKAQLRIGMCFEKLGKAEAVKAYEAVLAKYPEQVEAVTQARARLAALQLDEPPSLTVTRLAASSEYMECQTLSPDGTKVAGIVYGQRPSTLGQNVAVYDVTDGKSTLVTRFDWTEGLRTAYVPVWSPDGKQLAFQVGDSEAAPRQLWISDLAGASRTLFDNPDGGVAPADWLPDGSGVVVIVSRADSSTHLGVVSLRDGAFREIIALRRTYEPMSDARRSAAAGASADVSPDGTLVAFSDGPTNGPRDVFVVPIDGGSAVVVSDHPADDKEPRWSPDGRHVAFLSNRHGSWALWSVPFGEGKTLGPPTLALEGMDDAQLANWTGRGLVSRVTAGTADVYTLQIDPRTHTASGKPRVLAAQEHFGTSASPRWSPDGTHLAFLSLPRGSRFPDAIVVVPSAGEGEAHYRYAPRVAPQGGAWEWLPDSSGIGLVYWDKDNHLYCDVLDLGSGEWKAQAAKAEEFSKFTVIAWRGDGNAYFAACPGGGGSDPGVVVHELKTGEERYLLRGRPGDAMGWLFKASHDRKRLALSWNQELVLLDTETGQVVRPGWAKAQALFYSSWSPDGRYLLAKGQPSEKEKMTELFVVAVGDGGVTKVDIARFLPPKSRIMTMPDWSADGRSIAFDVWTSRSEANLIRNVLAGM
jgi:Tol biopolymer transport system component